METGTNDFVLAVYAAARNEPRLVLGIRSAELMLKPDDRKIRTDTVCCAS